MRSGGQVSLGSCSTSYPTWTVVQRSPGRGPLVLPRAAGNSGQEAGPEQRGVVIKSRPLTRSAAPPPQPAPIERSSAFLLKNRRHLEQDVEQEQQPRGPRSGDSADEEPFSGSAVEWVLRKADRSLDEIEENPPAYAKALYQLSTGPVGRAAAVGVTTAAKATAYMGVEALKAAAPAGKWALQQGFKLAAGAVAKGITSGKKQQQQQQGKKRK